MDEIGARLREARMRLEIDINEVETRTKIRAKYLRAMENQEWDLLPGEVYIRSFLRTYADFLGLDSRELVDDFRRQYENPSDHEPPPIAPPSREQRQRQRLGVPRRGVPPWVIIGVVLVVVAAVLYIVGTGNNSSQNDTTAGKRPSTAVRHHHRTHHRAKQRAKRPPPPAATSVTLTGVATGDVYVCLTNAKGKALIAGQTFSAGQTIPTQVAKTLLLTLGNASVSLKANGKTIPIQPSSAAIGLKLTPKGHSALPAAQQPSCA